MTKTQSKDRVYDLEGRTYNFAKDIRLWIKKIPKETTYWIRIILDTSLDPELDKEGDRLLNESIQLTKICSSIIENSLQSHTNSV